MYGHGGLADTDGTAPVLSHGNTMFTDLPFKGLSGQELTELYHPDSDYVDNITHCFFSCVMFIKNKIIILTTYKNRALFCPDGLNKVISAAQRQEVVLPILYHRGPRIPEQFFNQVFPAQPVSPEYGDGLIGNFKGGIGRENFGGNGMGK